MGRGSLFTLPSPKLVLMSGTGGHGGGPGRKKQYTKMGELSMAGKTMAQRLRNIAENINTGEAYMNVASTKSDLAKNFVRRYGFEYHAGPGTKTGRVVKRSRMLKSNIKDAGLLTKAKQAAKGGKRVHKKTSDVLAEGARRSGSVRAAREKRNQNKK